MGVLGLFTFLGYWDSFLWPLIVTNTTSMTVIPLGLEQFQGQHATAWNLMMAASAIAVLPGAILVLFLQRYLVEGITLTGMGGR